MTVEEQYADVLQNIESAVLAVYDGKPELVDREVLAAIDRLISTYEQEKRNHDGVARAPSGRAGRVYDQCRRICEWRLGRQPLNEDGPSDDDPRPGDLSIPELLLCLKRLRKSIRFWHKQGGRQGYLRYVREFLGDANAQLQSNENNRA